MSSNTLATGNRGLASAYLIASILKRSRDAAAPSIPKQIKLAQSPPPLLLWPSHRFDQAHGMGAREEGPTTDRNVVRH